MKRSISYLLFFFCLMVLTPLYAATQTLTTYYPAPQGNYKNINVTTLDVTGDTTLGTSGNTITVNGSTTTNGTATVNGNLTVNSLAGYQICSGGACAPLMVAKGSDGNYYAAYGP